MTEKRFVVIDAPYENGEPFLYKKMLDKTTKKEYTNTLKGIDDMCDLANKLNEKIKELKTENEILKKEGKHWVYADADCGNGCHNCSHEKGGICEILSCGTHSYIKGVSECGLKYWELKE